MSVLASVTLAILHFLYRLVLIFRTLSFRLHNVPRPLVAERSNLPKHLALSIIPNEAADGETNEKYMLDSVEKVATWCQVVGIRRLTVYDQEGVLSNCSLDIRNRVMPPSQGEDAEESPAECDIRYPLTPPPSDDAESRPLSPLSNLPVPKLSVITIRLPNNSPKSKRRASVSRSLVKRRRVTRHDEKAEEPPLILHIVSYKSGKPAIAAAATTLLHGFHGSQAGVTKTRSIQGSLIQELSAILEGEHGLPSPDLMIVHRSAPAGQLRWPVELAGFPPWQMRLSEIYWEPYVAVDSWWKTNPRKTKSSSIEETEFRRALDEFARAEMRLGK